ncbi:Auxin-responsive protein IAA29 [Morus notabilis]|uniref:Auxin-responsive protein n=1 Tax=Morus notabilis TaxID=981085 RepID=W9SZ29_9ROSA|nr:auxin-responsive protein IAA29 [Morus notabilis]EXC33724.1 Auxin-responsive protein IAA29 [Morus notabilis]
MELQLGLALLPSNSSLDHVQGFDLNKEGLIIGSNHHHEIRSNKKPRFCQAFLENNDDDDDDHHHQDSLPKTLPLLCWNNQPNEGDNDPYRDLHKYSTFSLSKNEGEDGVVGWPPIKSRRKRLCCNVGDRSEINRTVENGCSCGMRVSKFMYVKVKMEGMAIARKIDLSLHSCFGTLTDTLMDMFGKCQEDSGNHKLTYQDREGDWLLAQDVPWRTFIRSVQRLKLLRRM